MPPKRNPGQAAAGMATESGDAIENGSGSPPKRIKSDPDSAPFIDGKQFLPDQAFLAAIKHSRVNCGKDVSEFSFNKKRVRTLTKVEDIKEKPGGILYWMCRDMRAQDNWAFLYAQKLALKMHMPLQCCFVLLENFMNSPIRHYDVLLRGLKETAQECNSLNIPFHMLYGMPPKAVSEFVKKNAISAVVTDFSPLRSQRQWIQEMIKHLPPDVPLCQVDAHNIVPCWVTSDKVEVGARTIRRKIHDRIPEFLTHFPPLVHHPHKSGSKPEPIEWDGLYDWLKVDKNVKPVDWITPGPTAGLLALNDFITHRLKRYSTERNDPTKNAISGLSPWFHFGQLSVQRAILTVKKYSSRFKESVDGFFEEAVVRRELSDNFCYFNANYDNIKGALKWAQDTLRVHAKDKREHVYTESQLENAKTHDDLWNASQIQLLREGKMHGFLRMYWAKKILEWTSSPEEALRIAIHLNDKYSLDGRDPNGYVGCMWSVCGVHDQGWREREVFGKIRYMNYQGCQRKFDVPAFVRRYRATKS